jgi:hypothetical protein
VREKKRHKKKWRARGKKKHEKKQGPGKKKLLTKYTDPWGTVSSRP